MLKKIKPMLVAVLILLPVVTIAQQATNAAELFPGQAPGPAVATMMVDPGPVSTLVWSGLVVLAIASFVLGILSIKHCTNSRELQWPLTTKLLACAGVWVFIVGLFGAVHGGINSFAIIAIASPGVARQAMLSLNIADALYSIATALIVVHVNLVFLVVSVVKLRWRERKL